MIPISNTVGVLSTSDCSCGLQTLSAWLLTSDQSDRKGGDDEESAELHSSRARSSGGFLRFLVAAPGKIGL